VEEAWQAIDSTTIIFLLSMMIVNANLAYSGFFRLALLNLTRLTRSPLGLITVLTLGSGFLSAFFLNDTIAIIFTPLTLNLVQALRLNPIPYLLAVAGATNLGSVATISGNPQNILIGSFSKISYLNFAEALTPIALIGLVVQVGLLVWLYPEVRSLKPIAGELNLRSWVYQPLFVKTLGITIALLIAFMVGVPLAKAAFVAAALLFVTRRIKPERILREVDWNLLVMFSGLFVLTRCTQALNLLQFFTGWVNSALGLTSVTVILSNLISNVPAVLLLQPLIRPDDTQSWLLLAASSTLAGNLTLFGSVANLIVAEAAGNLGHRLSFAEHLRFGLPLTLITVAIAFFWLH
jgi:Na+/H+ antiporter NhaD/arsenite permease-like protein